MKKNTKQFRQGDVLVERVASVPKGAVKQDGRVILAHGEVTGHAHEIDSDTAEAWKEGEAMTVQVKKPTELKHQEHSAIPLKRGVYRVRRQSEYSPELSRSVAD